MGWWADRLKEIKDEIRATRDGLSTAVKAVKTKLADERGAVPGLLSGLVELMPLIGRTFVQSVQDQFGDYAAAAKAVASGEAMHMDRSTFEAAMKPLAKALGLSPEESAILYGYYQSLEGAGPMVQGACMVLVYVELLKFMMGPGLGKIAQSLFARFRPSVPDPGTVLSAAALDPTLDARIWAVLERNGYPKEDIELMFAGTYTRTPLEVLREVYYREGKDETWLDMRLEELRFTPERRAEIKAAFPALPSVSDLIMMQAKEAFEPDQIARFGLGAEPPRAIYEFTRKLGLADEWTDRYWTSHWIHPSWTQVMEMLHRGVIDWDTVYEWYRLVEIPPFWREAMTRISYTPFTRVDIRRMYAMGILSEAQVVKAYQDIGYDAEHARAHAEFVKRHTMSSEVADYVKLVLKRFRAGAITYAAAFGMMLEVGVREDKAGYELELAQYEETLAVQELQVESIMLRFKARAIERATAHGELTRLGLPAVQVSNYLLKWEASITPGDKLPSRTDLADWYTAGILTEAQWRSEMALLGYAPRYVELYWRELIAG